MTRSTAAQQRQIADVYRCLGDAAKLPAAVFIVAVRDVARLCLTPDEMERLGNQLGRDADEERRSRR